MNKLEYFFKPIIKFLGLGPTLGYIKHYFNPLSTYAQKQEDIAIEILIGRVKSFVDIGANDGISGSNTFLFALKGAKGLCFEPVPGIFNFLKKLYLLNLNVKCINEGVSDSFNKLSIRVDGALSTILETEDPTNKSCLKGYMNENAKTCYITVHPFTYFQRQFKFFKNIDLISIDVEGHELNVINGINFSDTNIKCIILESLGGNTTNYSTIESIIKHNDLYPVLTNELNTIFIHKSIINHNKINIVVTKLPEFRKLI